MTYCKHGHVGYCGLCTADAAPKCKHGKPFYCGLCAVEGEPKCAHENPFYCGHDGCGPVRNAKDQVLRMLKGLDP